MKSGVFLERLLAKAAGKNSTTSLRRVFNILVLLSMYLMIIYVSFCISICNL